MDQIEKRIIEIIDTHADELQAMAEDIFHHAEQGYHEYRTADIAAKYLKKLGLEPKTGLAITGLRASVGNGQGPNVALIGELDGLACPDHPAANKGYAHSCGHYAQMVCMLGAALALTDPEVAAALDGTATFYAVPAEEFQAASVREEVRREHDVHCGGGKCELLRRGDMDDIDMAVTTHSLMVDREGGADLMLGNSSCTGFIGKTVIMHGKAAHAAAAPHEGANALNAACLGMSALGMIRETFREKDCIRVHPYIREGGQAINVVPSEVIVDMMVRANTQKVIEEVSEKVDRCFQGGALAIGCTCEIQNAQGYMPCPEILPNTLMEETAALLGEGLNVKSIPAGVCNTASTDVGDLCSVMPVMNFTFGGSTGALHSVDYAVTDPVVAHIVPAKMMALLAYRLLKDGAKGAKEYIAGYKPAMTKKEYKAYCERMSG
ncbi:MAG: amidohydrolase [Oscillospiraceae bacterium]|nr:amidohydrolase [Oscillospiraceae bacterium]